MLRQQQVKPHWMFALDNLLRQAVQDAITVLLPGIFHSPSKRRQHISFVSGIAYSSSVCPSELKLQLQSSFEVEEVSTETKQTNEEPNAEPHVETNGTSQEPQQHSISARLPNGLVTSCSPLAQEFIVLCQGTRRYPGFYFFIFTFTFLLFKDLRRNTKALALSLGDHEFESH